MPSQSDEHTNRGGTRLALVLTANPRARRGDGRDRPRLWVGELKKNERGGAGVASGRERECDSVRARRSEERRQESDA